VPARLKARATLCLLRLDPGILRVSFATTSKASGVVGDCVRRVFGAVIAIDCVLDHRRKVSSLVGAGAGLSSHSEVFAAGFPSVTLWQPTLRAT
jgi:hypothetical protein